MNHHKKTRKFGRVKKVRDALIKSLALALILKGKIKTTDAKARELRPFVEKMVTIGKKDTVTTHRLLTARVGSIGAKKLIKDISPKYAKTTGGYTRITKLPARVSDGSLMAIIEFI